MKMKEKKMPTTVFDNIKGIEIPPPWLKKAKETPNTTFRVTLEVKTKISETQKETQNKWAKFAQEMENINFMGNGVGEYFLGQSKEFREDFQFKHDNEA